MNQTKSVKVDNWGVFFLQKLQNFFNKTDHCDLTLQFIDNSQLKVHRLVLSACTDYFNILENTCQMIEDVLIMPNDLQADVIVPIVNFMYTGTLEFQYNMYEKLLKTAKDMNMTVLLKLLEAHRQTSQKPQPVLLNKNAPKRPYPTAITSSTPVFIAPMQGNVRARTIQSRNIRPAIQTGTKQINVVNKAGVKTMQVVTQKSLPEPIAIVSRFSHTATKSRGPSRYVPVEEDEAMPELFDEQQFDEISYESKPLLTADQVKQERRETVEEPFEKLKHGYTNKSPPKKPTAFLSPPAKKPNLQDVKELAETMRLRKELTMDESEEDPPSYMEDDTHYNDDYDDEQQQQTAVGQKTQHITIQNKPTVSPQSNQITVKDEGGSVDHAKIISEVLKKYPHLVKNNKNIKLKIMQKSAAPISHVIKKEEVAAVAKTDVKSYGMAKSTAASQSVAGQAPKYVAARSAKTTNVTKAPPQIIATKPTPAPAKPSTSTAAAPSPSAPKKIDAKTMHALIAKGAENTTGPWLCLRCGISGRPISIPSYRSFRKHLVNVHKEIIDPLICEHCGLRSGRRLQQIHHMYTEHQVPPPSNLNFPKCTECDHVAINETLLDKHRKAEHPPDPAGNQQCIYCNKVFSKELLLYSHMRQMHKEKAREDGVMDFSDEEEVYEHEYVAATTSSQPAETKKINILSNISLLPPMKTGTFVIDNAKQVQSFCNVLTPSSEAEAMSNVASGIATSLSVGVFQQEDGTELQLTASEKEEIMSQLQGQTGGDNIVMVMNEDGQYVRENSPATATTTASKKAAADSNIMMVFSQADTDSQPSEKEAEPEEVDMDMEVDPKVEDVETHDELAASMEEIVGEKTCEASEKADDGEVATEQVVDQIIDEVKKEEVDDATTNIKMEESVESNEREKLISTLAGDWTDDDEMGGRPKDDVDDEPPVKKTAKDEPKEKDAATTRRTTRSSASKPKSDVEDTSLDERTKKPTVEGEDYLSKDESAIEEKLDSLLGDWTTEEENNSQDTSTGVLDESKETPEKDDDDDRKLQNEEISVEEAVPELETDGEQDTAIPEKSALAEKQSEKVTGNGEKPAEKSSTDNDADKVTPAAKEDKISTLMDDWDEDEDM